MLPKRAEPATEAGSKEGPREPPESTPKMGKPPPSFPQRGLGLKRLRPPETHKGVNPPFPSLAGGWSPLTGVGIILIWGVHPSEPPPNPLEGAEPVAALPPPPQPSPFWGGRSREGGGEGGGLTPPHPNRAATELGGGQ